MDLDAFMNMFGQMFGKVFLTICLFSLLSDDCPDPDDCS